MASKEQIADMLRIYSLEGMVDRILQLEAMVDVVVKAEAKIGGLIKAGDELCQMAQMEYGPQIDQVEAWEEAKQ